MDPYIDVMFSFAHPHDGHLVRVSRARGFTFASSSDYKSGGLFRLSDKQLNGPETPTDLRGLTRWGCLPAFAFHDALSCTLRDHAEGRRPRGLETWKQEAALRYGTPQRYLSDQQRALAVIFFPLVAMITQRIVRALQLKHHGGTGVAILGLPGIDGQVA